MNMLLIALDPVSVETQEDIHNEIEKNYDYVRVAPLSYAIRTADHVSTVHNLLEKWLRDDDKLTILTIDHNAPKMLYGSDEVAVWF